MSILRSGPVICLSALSCLELACPFDLNFDFNYTLVVYAQVRYRARDSECR